MATAVSIAIRRDDAQARIQAASIELAAKLGAEQVNLAPRHKQPEIQNVMVLEAIADFLERLAKDPPIEPLYIPPLPATEPLPRPTMVPAKRKA